MDDTDPWRVVGKACIMDVRGYNRVLGVEKLYQNPRGYYRVTNVVFPSNEWFFYEKRTFGPGLQAMRVHTNENCYGFGHFWMLDADF